MQFASTVKYLQEDNDLTERLQKLVTRLVKALLHFPYERLLEILGLPSLVHLRLRADLVLVYKILHGRVNLPVDQFFETPANPNLHGHRFKLCHQPSHLVRRKFAFRGRMSNRGISCRPKLLILPRKKFSNVVLMVFGTPCLFPNPPRTSNKFVFNLSFLPFVQMPVWGYLARKCLSLDHLIFLFRF